VVVEVDPFDPSPEEVVEVVVVDSSLFDGVLYLLNSAPFF